MTCMHTQLCYMYTLTIDEKLRTNMVATEMVMMNYYAVCVHTFSEQLGLAL